MTAITVKKTSRYGFHSTLSWTKAMSKPTTAALRMTRTLSITSLEPQAIPFFLASSDLLLLCALPLR